MSDKLKSRKLLVALTMIGVVAIATFMGIDLPAENAEALMGTVAAYLLGQGAVDVAATIKAGRVLGEAAQEMSVAAEEASATVS
jgi:hypothetical protein